MERKLTACLIPALGTALLLLVVAGCAAPASEQVHALKERMEEAATGLKEAAGSAVPSLDQVNGQLAVSGAEVISLLRELRLDMSFQQNGIAFSNPEGLSGLIGISGNSIVLEISSPSDNANALKNMLRVAQVFSENRMLEERLRDITGSNQIQEVQLDNGYIRTDGETVEIRLSTPLS